MDESNNIKDKIEQETAKRLKLKLENIEDQIRKEVEEEFNKQQQKEQQQKVQILKKEKEEFFIRFSLNLRIQHFVLITTTIMLILTGVPLKFPKNDVSQFIINLFSGTAGARSVHHLFALGMIAAGIYHLFYIFWFGKGRKDFFELLPKFKDFTDLTGQLKYYLGFRKTKVKFRRFSYVEKFDYWAVYWGLVMMIGTGAVMWLFQGKFDPLIFGEISLPFGPQLVTNSLHAICREMHSDEALLATLVIIGWHFYNVHLNPHKFPMSMVWLNGKISKKDIQEEHALEYEELTKKVNSEASEDNREKRFQ